MTSDLLEGCQLCHVEENLEEPKETREAHAEVKSEKIQHG